MQQNHKYKVDIGAILSFLLAPLLLCPIIVAPNERLSYIGLLPPLCVLVVGGPLLSILELLRFIRHKRKQRQNIKSNKISSKKNQILSNKSGKRFKVAIEKNGGYIPDTATYHSWAEAYKVVERIREDNEEWHIVSYHTADGIDIFVDNPLLRNTPALENMRKRKLL